MINDKLLKHERHNSFLHTEKNSAGCQMLAMVISLLVLILKLLISLNGLEIFPDKIVFNICSTSLSFSNL